MFSRLLVSALTLGFISSSLLAQRAPLCRAAQLEPFVSGEDCGSGRCQMRLDLRNTGSTACTLPSHSTARALDAQHHILRREHVRSDGPMVLKPGDFADYETESYSAATFPHAPAAASTYLLRFDPADPGFLRLPGNQRFIAGPQETFDEDDPQPDLSHVPTQASGDLALSAFLWPPEEHSQYAGNADLLEDTALGNLHISVRNTASAPSAGWNTCHITVEVAEQGANQPPARTTYPCCWNGDVREGIIAAGATAATEVDAITPKVCHHASFGVRVRVEGAPVTFQPITLTAGPYQPLCSDSQPSAHDVVFKVPPFLHASRVVWGLPVAGVRLGIELPVRRYLDNVIAIDDPGDPVLAAIWVDNNRDQPLPLAGPHAFHFRILDPSVTPPVEMRPAESADPGAIDIVIPPRTKRRVFVADLSAQYRFTPTPLPKDMYLIGVYPESLTGTDARYNWSALKTKKDNIWALKALTSVRIEPHGVSR